MCCCWLELVGGSSGVLRIITVVEHLQRVEGGLGRRDRIAMLSARHFFRLATWHRFARGPLQENYVAYIGARPAAAHMTSTSRHEPLCTRCVATWNASSSHVKMLQKVCGLRSILSTSNGIA